MQIFGIDLWRIILCIVLIFLVVMRANLVALFAIRSYGKGDTEKALKIFSVASKVGNLNVSNRLTYAYLLLRSGYPDKAQRELRLLLPYTKVKSAERYRLKNLMALSHWKLNNLSEAIEEMEEIIQDGYKNTLIYQNLGLLYNLGDNPEKAIRFNEEAYEYNSDDNVIADNLADAYHLGGETEKALKIYEELFARKNEPNFPEAYYGYGRLLIEVGDRDKGMEFLEKALSKPFSYLSVISKSDVEDLLGSIKEI